VVISTRYHLKQKQEFSLCSMMATDPPQLI